MTKDILPFKAYFYNQSLVTSLKEVVSPPYDVIHPDLQNELYEKSPYNFCRLDLTKEQPPERYEVAKKLWQDWIAERVLIQDSQSAIYLHYHTFVLPNGQKTTRKGFFAARKIEDFAGGKIKPHEKTLEGPKQDRLNLMRATHSQLSPVFSLYSDPENAIFNRVNDLTQTTPFMDFTTEENERHQIWKVKDEALCDFIDQFLNDHPLFIADGHHRYETALNYRNEMLEQNPDLPENAACRYIMMYFSNLNDEGMVILPIHRALHSLSGFQFDALLEKLGRDFDIQEMNLTDEEEITAELAKWQETHHAFYLLTKNKEKSYLIKISREKWSQSELSHGLADELKPLDVSVLHKGIFEKVLQISEEAQARQENIIYWKSTQKAIHETWEGKCEVTFLLNPTRIQDMESVALAGLKMPQKSTFFYPKIISGLLVHSVKSSDKDGF